MVPPILYDDNTAIIQKSTSEIIEANSPEFVACPENEVESFLEYEWRTLTSDDESIATIDKMVEEKTKDIMTV